MAIRPSMKAALLGSAAVFILGTAAHAADRPIVIAQAATPPAEEEAAPPAPETERVTVTGSRIARPETSGSIPGMQLGQQELENKGFTRVSDAILDLPLVGASVSQFSSPAGTPFANGASFVDALDLGTQRTLTMLNGRRIVSGSVANYFLPGNETGSQVDINLFPLGLVDRIDVLTVGGATAYGADAIAGVVNLIYRRNFDGTEIDVTYGQAEEGGATYLASATQGLMFDEDRGNLILTAEYNKIEALMASDRSFRQQRLGTFTNFANGARRNPAFSLAPAAPGSIAGNVPFLAGGTDGVPGVGWGANLWSTLNAPQGVIYRGVSSTGATLSVPAVNQIGTVPGTTMVSGATQFVSGTPRAYAPTVTPTAGANTVTIGGTVIGFAPTALPAALNNPAGHAAILAFYGAVAPGGSTAAQIGQLALQVLQANRPTEREFFAANPTASPLAFVGSALIAYPGVANAGPFADILPRIATPIRFNNAGNVVSIPIIGALSPTQGGTLGASPGADQMFDALPWTFIRQEQERQITGGNFTYDITENLGTFVEFSIAENEAKVPFAIGASNIVTTTTVENQALLMHTSNPFLDAGDRAALTAAGIPDAGAGSNFVLSKNWIDVLGNAPIIAETSLYRIVGGVNGDFEFDGAMFNWEVSVNWGESSGLYTSSTVKDVEMAMALDVALDGAGNIVCRSQLPGYIIPAIVPGVDSDPALVPGPDGIPVLQSFRGAITPDLITACRPLNPFGFNQMSEASKSFVAGKLINENVNEMMSYAGFISGSLFDLPGGVFSTALSAEYRVETSKLKLNDLQQLGRGRSVPIGPVDAEFKTWEAGLEFEIPIFGDDFNFFGLRELVFRPSARLVQLEGTSAPYRNALLPGTPLIQPNYQGDIEEIYSLAGEWRPFTDLLIRANQQRTVRQPSAVELFNVVQGGFLNGTADPCATANIAGGPNPALRAANCAQDLVNRGISPNIPAAQAFLLGYNPPAVSVKASVSGNQNVTPEFSDAFTAGFVYQPDYIENLTLTLDYVRIELFKRIGLGFPPATNVGGIQSTCYDSTTFPVATFAGQNMCTTLVRNNTTFQFADGWGLPIANTDAVRLQSFNMTAAYRFDLAGALRPFGFFEDELELGTVLLSGNAYHVREYASSSNGAFNPAVPGSYNNTGVWGATSPVGGAFTPRWETSANFGYRLGDFFAQWTWDWTDAMIVSTGATIETQPQFRLEDYSVHSLTLRYEVIDELSAQVTINNLFDQDAIGDYGAYNGVYASQVGRYAQFTLRAQF